MTEKARAPQDLASLRARLAQLDTERTALSAEIEQLAQAEPRTEAPGDASVTAQAPPAAKITLFRGLFRGRTDVYPLRWEKPKTGRSGYAPACETWRRSMALQRGAVATHPTASMGDDDAAMTPAGWRQARQSPCANRGRRGGGKRQTKISSPRRALLPTALSLDRRG